MAGRGSTDALQAGDVWILNDAFKPGLEKELVKPFTKDVEEGGRVKTKPTSSMKRFYLIYDEASLRNRLRCSYSPASARQVEHMYVHTAADLALHEKPRRHFSGTNRGECIMPIVMTPLAEHWSLTWAKKKALYASNLCRVGGPATDLGAGDVETADTEPEAKRSLTSTVAEPVFFHGFPSRLVEEIIHSFNLNRGLINLTASEGLKEMAAIRSGVVCFPVVFNEVHQELLAARLVDLVLMAMGTEKDELYNPTYAATQTSKTKDDEPPQPPPPPSNSKLKEAKPPTTLKSKQHKGKKRGARSSSSSSENKKKTKKTAKTVKASDSSSASDS